MFLVIGTISQHLEAFHQPHCRTGGDAAHQDHLYTPNGTLADISTTAPATDKACLYISEDKQRNDHGSNGPPQGDEGFMGSDEKVWYERNKSTDKVS